ncbi:MAG: glycosyltransferase [Bacillus sp. (in: Bacteria)]|nr:glycosyltransferase [Bacillus sp. (in: firmicutes)]MCM1425847.1 glycosyltransferase [Eubacterium sp.]
MEREKVSVIIPTYNRAYCIENSIRSVLEQTYRELELIVVDDGSSDNTHDVVNSIEDERIRYIKMPENKGVSAARNEGIRQAAYDYIAFQDSDDVWKPDKLEKQMKVLIEAPQAGLVYCEFEARKSDDNIFIVPDKSVPLSDKQGDIYDKLLCRNTISTQTVLARRECLLQTGLFCENLSCIEDWEFFLRIAKDYEIVFVEEPLVIVNVKTGGVSSNVAGYFEARCYMIAQHREALLQAQLFNKVVEDVLLRAQESGILEQVNKMMQLYLR